MTESSSPIVASGEEMAQRWGSVGEAIQAAGFAGVHAYPMRWRGRALAWGVER